MTTVEPLVSEDGRVARLRIGAEEVDLGASELEQLIWRLMDARGAMVPRRLPVQFCGDRIVEAVAATVRHTADGRRMSCLLTAAGWVGAVMPAQSQSRRRKAVARTTARDAHPTELPPAPSSAG